MSLQRFKNENKWNLDKSNTNTMKTELMPGEC